MCDQFLAQFTCNQYETLLKCNRHKEDVHKTCAYKNNFDKILLILIFSHFLYKRLHYRLSSLCNQLLKEFLSNQYETMQRCYKHTEDVRVTFLRCKNYF